MATGIVWRPTKRDVERSVLGRFMAEQGIGDYEELHARSIEDPGWFWDAALGHLGIEWFRPYDEVLDISDGVPFARWFRGGRLNLTHNAVDRHAAGPLAGKTALIHESEDGGVRSYTYRDLKREVDKCATVLKSLGVGMGDRVGIFMPMIPEAVVAALAVPKVGAIYAPMFSGYAADAVASRLSGCKAKLLITADGFSRRGKTVPIKETADAALRKAPVVERALVVRYAGLENAPRNGARDVWWHESVEAADEGTPTEHMDPEDPFMIIYTSGTTGRPKGCVHVHGGFLPKAVQDMAHLFDVTEESTFYWITDMGWMMGPWLIVGALTLGATLLVGEGAPDHPGPDRTWELASKHGVTHLGISPTFVRSVMDEGDDLVEKHDLSRLRCFGSTGEPWNPRPWEWLFRVAGRSERPIINYSGGTEVSGGLLGCSFLQPQKPCAFSGPPLGIAADVADAEGNPLRGEVGELVVRKPWPGMTRGFWGERDRYLETYWSRIPGLWLHGDWAEIDEDGFWFVRGRSDDTVNVAGKRVGPAEIESVLVSHPAVKEAAAIGVPDTVKGEALVAFVVLNGTGAPSQAVADELVNYVGVRLGKGLRPREVFFVEDLPRTRNQKIMRRVIRAAYLGEDLGDLSGLENVQAVAGLPPAQ